MLFVAIQPYTVRGFRRRKPPALLPTVSKVLCLQQLCGFYWNLSLSALICFYVFSLSLTCTIISQFVILHCTLSLSACSFLSHKLPIFFFSDFTVLSELPLFHPRQFQFHIYYIFNSINPIRNWGQELPEDATAQNMFHNRSSGSIGWKGRMEGRHLICSSLYSIFSL